MSNPDAQYKSYFRDSYDAFALASDTHLKWIRQEVLRDRYVVSHASKIMLPKASGTLRPLTLLTVDDQIVYQACVNLIADALKRKTGRRYEVRVFAHLYAGRTSAFFYKQWQSSYRKFGQRIRQAHAKGYDYVANFDLTSFYDTIDHNVLRHFLTSIGIDEDAPSFRTQESIGTKGSDLCCFGRRQLAQTCQKKSTVYGVVELNACNICNDILSKSFGNLLVSVYVCTD
jgi:hypothetical protein